MTVFVLFIFEVVEEKNLYTQQQGKLVDDSDDSEDDLSDDDSNEDTDSHRKKISAEARFTRRFTQYYDLIGCHFPVLLRLRELAKLNAISAILRSIYNSLEEKKSQLTPPRDAVQNILEDLRRAVTYPICTASKVRVVFIFFNLKVCLKYFTRFFSLKFHTCI